MTTEQIKSIQDLVHAAEWSAQACSKMRQGVFTTVKHQLHNNAQLVRSQFPEIFSPAYRTKDS
jgi:hypothetical protein